MQWLVVRLRKLLKFFLVRKCTILQGEKVNLRLPLYIDFVILMDPFMAFPPKMKTVTTCTEEIANCFPVTPK